MRELLLGDLESGAGLGPRVPDHWSCQIHTFRAEMIGRAGRDGSRLSAHGAHAAKACLGLLQGFSFSWLVPKAPLRL